MQKSPCKKPYLSTGVPMATVSCPEPNYHSVRVVVVPKGEISRLISRFMLAFLQEKSLPLPSSGGWCEAEWGPKVI